MTGPDEDRRAVEARFSYMWRKVDGVWKIVHHHSSALPKVPGLEEAAECENMYPIAQASRPPLEVHQLFAVPGGLKEAEGTMMGDGNRVVCVVLDLFGGMYALFVFWRSGWLPSSKYRLYLISCYCSCTSFFYLRVFQYPSKDDSYYAFQFKYPVKGIRKYFPVGNRVLLVL